MSNFTAADVKKLRDLTGAGMMDCKKALTETDGDFDKAIEILRIKGAKDVGKRAERATAQGLVAAADGVMVELNCETDFVAKNDEFIQLADKVVAAAKAAGAADLEAVKAAQLDGQTAEEAVQALSAKIGEKLELRRAVAYTGTVSTYLHRRSSDLPPAVGVLVEYTGDNEEAARAAAMQIAAMRPRYVTRDEVPEDVVANERRIAEETAREEGKPEAALPKITEGRVNGFFKDVVLLEQSSVLDSKKTVKAVLDEAGVTVTGFARFEVGQS
ncbi:translation elongation factor Ts [Actinokineospora bangkokensis]|uniref:Elongation factor Ts n=1 Tax=Actinokineospora bangkokensis TaxID=1193682 RepID=A0A1Q9LHL3_9PSEU|nr:translation elongation factor Ts [Actinokineospora bangkokensis]OLR91528.1 translation elongation factor Ts [Actinokineospora bangkokensis]